MAQERERQFAGWRLAMSSLDKMLGWFPHNHREWIEFIIVALLWLLMVVGHIRT